MSNDTPPTDTDAPNERRMTRDLERIRKWAEARDAVPVRIRDSDDHGHSFARRDEVGEGHEEYSWEEFERRFDDEDYVFVYHEDEPTGEGVGFFEIAEREQAFERADLGRDELEDSLRRGETVTTEIVEIEVVERDTIESEVVETELVERDIVASERRDREVVETEFVGDSTIEVIADETRLDTIEEIERYIVESRVVDVDIEQDQEMERDEVETDVELESVQRSILEGDVVRSSVTPDEVLEREVIRSQRTEGDAVRSELIERRTVEEERDERLKLRYALEESELLESDVVRSETLAGEIIDVEEYGSIDAGGMGAESDTAIGDETTASAASGTGTTDETAAPAIELTGDKRGKDVVDESGQQIGMIAEVEGQTAYVDPEPGVTDRLKARMNWGGHGDDDYPIQATEITEITDHEVVIRSE